MNENLQMTLSPWWKQRGWRVAVGLLFIMLVSLYLRGDSLTHWLDNKNRFFFQSQQIPLLLGVDGYYYLDIARELQQGNYQPLDLRRGVPQGLERSTIAPLASVLTASLANLFAVPLEWVAIILAPVLGTLLAVPAFLLGRAFGLRAMTPWLEESRRYDAAAVMGLVTALFTVLSPYMLSRSMLGWYETDPLNVSFAIMAAFFALYYGDVRHKGTRSLWFAGWAVTLLLFYWWWQAAVAVLVLAAGPMLIAFFIMGWRTREALLGSLFMLGCVVIALIFFQGVDALTPTGLVQQFFSLLNFITGDDAQGSFRSVSADVSEQLTVSVERFMENTTGGLIPFTLAIGGLLGLAVTTGYRVLYLTALFFVTALSVTGVRFMIFAAPLFGLGIGFIAFSLWGMKLRLLWRAMAIILISLGIAWWTVPVAESFDSQVPRRKPALFDAMLALRQQTQEDAVIWASWGHGHPLVYYANRGTIADGGYHPAALRYALNFPLTVSDQRLAANWMGFVAAHGLPGLIEANALFGKNEQDWSAGMARLQALLAKGVNGARDLLLSEDGIEKNVLEKRLAFLFPGARRPLYLMLDELLLTEDWFGFGQWDFKQQVSPHQEYLILHDVKPVRPALLNALSSIGKAQIDMGEGEVRFLHGKMALRQITLLGPSGLKGRNFSDNAENSVHIVTDASIGVLAGKSESASLLNQLFFELNGKSPYFMLKQVLLPIYSIWQVTPESSSFNVQKNT